MYYNTNDESGTELFASRKNADNQGSLVLGVFQSFPNENLSPDDITKYISRTFDKDYPITSIRRAITDLTKEGDLVKTSTKKMGSWGKKVHTWKLNNK